MPRFWNTEQLADSERNCSELLAPESGGGVPMDFQYFSFNILDLDYFKFIF